MFGKRKLSALLAAPFHPPHYRAAANMLRRYERPLDGFWRYVSGRGSYPVRFAVKTPGGAVAPTLYTYHDMRTVNEIFCREDYRCGSDVEVVVDFGSNIGISALYFLTTSDKAFAYLFEPLPQNQERLRANLRGFESRYRLAPVAVGLADGDAEFGFEASGRYGGIGLQTGQTMRVPCRDSNAVLDEILAKHARIDVLKVDIETLEKEIVGRLGARAASIRNIFVEQSFDGNPLPATHRYTQYGSVARFAAIH